MGDGNCRTENYERKHDLQVVIVVYPQHEEDGNEEEQCRWKFIFEKRRHLSCRQRGDNARQRAARFGRFTFILAKIFLTRMYETMSQPTLSAMVIAIADSSSCKPFILERLRVKI